MSLRGVRKVVADLNSGLRIYKFAGVVKPNYTGAVLDASVPKDISLLNKQLSALSLCNSQVDRFSCKSPILDIPIKKTIIEPNQNVKINFELPIRKSTSETLDLPLRIEKEIAEPGKVISKKARHLTIIRRRKMKKHKQKKYLRKYKVELAHRQLLKEMADENKFQQSLRVILQEKDDFSAEKYVSEMLEKAHWKRPVTSVKGMLAPRRVIEEYLKEKEEKRMLRERLKECSK